MKKTPITAGRVPWLKNKLGALVLTAGISFAMHHQVHAQIEYNQWTFGNQSGFDVSTGNLVTTSSSSLEEAAVWCNSSGNLWVHSNGRNIYCTSPAQTCTNCLNGWPNNSYASQGVLILPVIGQANQFYFFTVSDATGAMGSGINTGLSYDIYNTSNNTVNGETQLGWAPGTYGSFVSERLTAVPHSNGTDYWIIVKPIIFAPGTPGAVITSSQPNNPTLATNNSIYAYLVSASGVSSTPVISDAGFASTITTSTNHFGNIKFSPSREFAALTEPTSSTSGNTHMYRFNSATGEFEHLISMPMLTGYRPLGLSFSPNSKMLYVTAYKPAAAGVNPDDDLRQYDLTNFSCNTSVVPPFCDLTSQLADLSYAYSVLQLAPNGKIYRSHEHSTMIDVINTPNNAGCANIGYQHNAQTVATVGYCGSGLPNNIDAKKGPQATSAWPKTTNGTAQFDAAKAIESDQYSGIYAAGEYRYMTNFEGMNVGSGIAQQAYLAKYDNCKGLQWVAHTESTGAVSLTSMTLHRSQGFVYVTGRYYGITTFYDAQAYPAANLVCNNPQTIFGSGVYVAIYNYSGCLLSVYNIADGALQHLSAHITVATQVSPNPSQVRVHLAVNESDNKTVQIYALTHVSVGSPVLNLSWTKSVVSTAYLIAGDISSYRNSVVLTGTFERDVNWNNTGVFGVSSTGVREAYVLALTDVSNAPVSYYSKDMDAANATVSSGIGVYVQLNDIYLTGTFTGAISNPFNIGNGANLVGNNAYTCAYGVHLNTASSTTNWGRTVMADGNVVGADIYPVSNSLYLTGTWEGTTFGVDNTVLPPTVPSKPHMYTMRMETGGNFNTAGCWQNHSLINNGLTEWARPARLTANATYVYNDGSYKGTVQMLTENGANAPLTSTANTYNSFVWRYSVATGSSLRQAPQQDDNSASVPASGTVNPSVYPNPASSAFTLDLGSSNSACAVEIYSASGVLMLNETVSGSNKQIDVSSWANGLYLVRITRGSDVFVQKLMKN